jgi:hypothetical protein
VLSCLAIPSQRRGSELIWFFRYCSLLYYLHSLRRNGLQFVNDVILELNFTALLRLRSNDGTGQFPCYMKWYLTALSFHFIVVKDYGAGIWMQLCSFMVLRKHQFHHLPFAEARLKLLTVS